MSEDNRNTDALLAQRQSAYGDVADNAARVANMWNGYLGTDIITPADMMMMMALYKAYRFKVTPDYSDNINDVLGYAEIVRRVQEATGGLVDAETVKEYYAKKAEILAGETETPAEATDARDIAFEAATEATVQDYVNLYGTAEERAAQEEIAESRRPPEFRRGLPDQTEGRMMEQWLRNRCAADTGLGPCILSTGHSGLCAPGARRL